ncbi:MAG TPA: FAD-dependent monooxygenase, partial [Thermoanaerobaculia bacterium]|nr:FAD-dependent monooxygenase [Thermoanaerobaculia bacterium]
MTLRCDVAVVGGSLAGSAAAGALARDGVDVVVIEKARFPRAKICGEFLSYEALPALERLGALAAVRGAGAETISRFTVVRPDGRAVEAPLASPVLSISRERLDTIVARAAEGVGARFLFGSPVLALEGGLGKGFRLEGPDLAVEARVVIGAWGRYAPLDGKLGRPFFGRPATLFGFKKHLSGESARLAGRAVLHVFPGGYLGLSRVEGGAVNLAALASPALAKEAHHDFDLLLGGLRERSPALARDLDGLVPEPGPVLLSEPVHLGAHGAIAHDVLLAGDAAGVLDPYTGAGMATALLTGEAAGEPVAAFLQGRLSAAALREAHARRHREIAGARFFWSRVFRPIFGGGAATRLVLP